MWDASRFRRDEDGALLVFFAICAAAIFLVAALSFDLGRRASTQTELQSYADNVALAAAGELDGFPMAMARANAAAQNLITDSFVFGSEADGGTGRVLSGSNDYTIEFYSRLPDDENVWPTSTTIGQGASAVTFVEPLLQTDPANDARARYARIIVNDVDVPWAFANLLSIFSSDPLPDEAVAAEATAGFTSFACDVTPFFFCLPDPVTGVDTGTGADPETPPGLWYPSNHIGDTVLLRSGGNNAASWGPGNFGWLDVRDAVPQDIVDSSSDCAAETNQTQLLLCLIAAENSGIACFQNGLLATLTGQAVGIESAVFNTRFDIFNATSGQNVDDPNFAPAPLNMNGIDISGECAGNNPPSGNTLPLPVDDCFTDGVAGSCITVGGLERFGDGNWMRGRREYVEANYSRDPATIGTIETEELVTFAGEQYHIDDPFRPDAALASDGTTVVTKTAPFAGLPDLGSGATRFEYYSAEVEAVYAGVADGANVPTTNPLIDELTRDENGLPTCATEDSPTNYSRDPARRNFVAAVVDCDAESVQGNTPEVRATYFIEVFLPQRIEGVSNFDLYVEIVDGPLNDGAESIEKGTFRNSVQLYR